MSLHNVDFMESLARISDMMNLEMGTFSKFLRQFFDRGEGDATELDA